MNNGTNIPNDEIEDADFDDVIEMDHKSLKMKLPTVFNPKLEELYDFNNIFDLKANPQKDLEKSELELEEEIKESKLRADFLREVNERNFSPFEKIKNNYYLDGVLAIKVKKSLFGKVKGAEAAPNASSKIISAMLSEYKPVITDIEVDNPDFMDNFKQGLIMAVDEDDFDIDTLKVASGCPKRKEMLKLIDEVKNRNSLKLGDELDKPEPETAIKNSFKLSDTDDILENIDDELELSSIGYDDEMSDSDYNLELLALENFDNPDLKLLAHSPDSPLNDFNNEIPTLPAPEQDFDKVFNVDDLSFDDDLEIKKDTKKTFDRNEEMESLKDILSKESEPDKNSLNKSNRNTNRKNSKLRI
ncbi:hypothetical protein I6F48_00425 [Pseudoalteromonas sp. SWYJ118]|uniref:hypothetical protein n=1 Tax=Pseudoalteromonas sp. SWYJ118 TaxID=2792062 RepID=UPI0018CD78E6|nr:hypothetical protein [Pseudoalteromonas sp. SWYJ118]MBH0074029.1 hypothetical protein [Pseudoalteromonas sp. SWYJ118]